MEVLLTGTLVENTFQSKLKAWHACSLKSFCISFYAVRDLSDARPVVFALASGARHPPAILGTRQTA